MQDMHPRESRYAFLAVVGSVLLLFVYILLRYVFTAPLSLALSQVLFLATPATAAVLSGLIAARAPRRSRSRLAWSLLTLATVMLFLAEASYSWNTIVEGLPSDPIGGIADIASATATLAFLVLIGVSSPSPAHDRTRTARRILDLLAVGTLGFVFAFRFGVVDLLGMSASEDVLEAARFAVYTSIGLVVVAGTLLTMRSFGTGASRLWLRLLRTGIALLGIGIMAFPLWSLAATGKIGGWGDPLANLVYLLAYLLMAFGAGARLRDTEASWGWGSNAPETGSVLPGMVATTLTFTSVVVLGFAAVSAPALSTEQNVYFVALSVATACLVGRTALNSAEVSYLKDVAETDPLTGVGNRRRMTDRMKHLVAASARFDEPFLVAVVDVDDFSRVNNVDGPAAADRLLQQIATELQATVGREAVFRLSGDNFVALAPCESRAAGDRLANLMLGSVDFLGTGGERSTASIGYAVFPFDSAKADEILRLAEGALAWAKYHGKNRVVAHDADIVVELTSQERQALDDDPARLEVARALAAASDAQDPGNYRHARNVASLSVMLARELGWDADNIGKVEVAAMLHDVGKIAVPLSSSPRAVRSDALANRQHADLGAYMVESLELDEVPDWVRAHHERWDGAGYPLGLRGEEIPLASRIISLADAYDVITSGGSGRPARSKSSALQEIDLGLGTRFDPQLGETFIEFVGKRVSLGWRDAWPAA